MEQNSNFSVKNEVLRPTYSPTVPVGGTASYKFRLGFTNSNGCWKVYRRFHRDFFLVWGEKKLKRGFVGGSFHGGICHGGGDFQ